MARPEVELDLVCCSSFADSLVMILNSAEDAAASAAPSAAMLLDLLLDQELIFLWREPMCLVSEHGGHISKLSWID